MQVRAPPLQTTRSVRSVRVRLELDLSRILSNAKQCRVCIVCSTRNSNYSHVDSFTSYSRVALPGPSESVNSVPSSDPHSAFDSRLRPGPPLTPRHTTSRLRTAGTAFLSTLSQSSERVRGPGHCNSRTDCAPCAVFARSSDGRAAARRTNVVRCASTVPSTSCWDLGGAVSHFVSSENKSRTVEYKSAAADAPTMSMIYVARPRRSPITNY